MKKVGRTANPLPYKAGNKLSLIVSPEGQQTSLIFPARLFRFGDVFVLDGKIARIICAVDATRRIGDDTEPLLTVFTPSANQTVLFIRPHDQIPLNSQFPVRFCKHTILIQI
jgi:hypothetical protein